MTKRLLDIGLSAFLLAAVSPLLVLAMLAIWVYDGHAPLFWAVRVGRGGRDFRMVKLRSMAVGAEHRGAASTARSDERITPVGALLRRWKIDELPQFWNVLVGDMSLVGPRPNIRQGGVDQYSDEEMRLLTVRPGVTDLSSIMFLDEADILDGAPDPHKVYNLVIRPWKSRLGLLYIDNRGHLDDLRIVWLTAMAIIAPPFAREGVEAILDRWRAPEDLRRICRHGVVPYRAEQPEKAA